MQALPELDAYRAGRMAELQAKLDARQDRPGFKRNVQALRREIAQLRGDGGTEI